MLDLSKGLIPKHWMSYVVPDNTSFGVWLADLEKRVKQLKRLGASEDLGKEAVWLGGLFNPEGFFFFLNLFESSLFCCRSLTS